MTQTVLFDEVVRASRLNRLVAPFTITRLLVRADVLPGDLTPMELARALPELETGLSVYLEPEDLRAAVDEIRTLAEGRR